MRTREERERWYSMQISGRQPANYAVIAPSDQGSESERGNRNTTWRAQRRLPDVSIPFSLCPFLHINYT